MNLLEEGRLAGFDVAGRHEFIRIPIAGLSLLARSLIAAGGADFSRRLVTDLAAGKYKNAPVHAFLKDSEAAIDYLQNHSRKLSGLKKKAQEALTAMEGLRTKVGGSWEQEIELARSAKFDADDLGRDIASLIEHGRGLEARYRALLALPLPGNAVTLRLYCSNTAAQFTAEQNAALS